jgi:hypothetical protein
MTVVTDEVEASEIGPVVTVEAAGIGMSTRKRYRVYREAGLAPVLDGRVTVAAAEGRSHVVRADVAAVAVSRLNIETTLLVTVQARRHRAGCLTRGSVEAVAHRAVALTACDGCRRLQDGLMRDVQELARGRVPEVSVTQQTGRFEAQGGIRHQLAVSGAHLVRARGPAVTGDAAQPSVNGLDGRSLDEQTLALAFRSRERLNLLRVGVAIYAFTRERSGVIETGQRRRGLRVFS